MTSVPRPGSLSAPPHGAPRIVISLSAPAPEVPVVSIPHPLPQAVAIEEAAEGSLDSALEYWIEAEDIPELAANAVVVVDAATQYSRLLSRPGSTAASPCPLVGIRIAGVLEAITTSAEPVYQAPQLPPPSQTPPPPPLYADSAPRVHRPPSPRPATAHALLQRRRAAAGAASLRHKVLFVELLQKLNRHGSRCRPLRRDGP